MLKKITIMLFLYYAAGTCASQAGTKPAAGQGSNTSRTTNGARIVICGSR